MLPTIYALDVTPIDPEWKGWECWIDATRLTAAAQFRLREDQARSIGAGYLLAYAVHEVYPTQPLPLHVETDSLGKPFLPELPDFHFNLSHSGKWAVCAVADHPIGIDIEQIGHPMEDVVARFFSPAERAHLHTLHAADQPTAFCESWVLKESYMKATGLGFHLPIKHLRLQLGPPAVLLRDGSPIPGSVTSCPFPDPAYRLAIAHTLATPFHASPTVNILSNIEL